MRLVFSSPAAQDLEAIIDYIAEDNPAAAVKVADAIQAAAERLLTFPDMGRVGRLPDTRELVVADLPYMIVYQVKPDAVVVLAVFRGARDLARALSERQSPH